MEPDPSLPSITPSPPKPHSPRAPYHHQHQSNQLASSLEIMSFTFIPLSLPFFQPFPAPHCYLPKQQTELIWMPLSFYNALMCQNSNATIPTTPLPATLFPFPATSSGLC